MSRDVDTHLDEMTDLVRKFALSFITGLGVALFLTKELITPITLSMALSLTATSLMISILFSCIFGIAARAIAKWGALQRREPLMLLAMEMNAMSR